MIRYIIYRILGLLGVLFVVTIITFSLMHAVPGGPFDEEKMPLSAEAKANILRKYGLDRPLYEQYSRYMWNAIQFDFGIPFQSPGETVTDLIARTWPISMQLGGMGLALAFAGGILLGILSNPISCWSSISAFCVFFVSFIHLTCHCFIDSIAFFVAISNILFFDPLLGMIMDIFFFVFDCKILIIWTEIFEIYFRFLNKYVEVYCKINNTTVFLIFKC